MIETSRVTDALALTIFEHFHNDHSLPKYRREVKSQSSVSQSNVSFAFDVENVSQGGVLVGNTNSWLTFPSEGRMDVNNSKGLPFSFRERLVMAVMRVLRVQRRNAPKEWYGNVSPLDIFANVRGSLQEAKDYTVRVETYDAVIKQAQVSGQRARCEQLMRARQVIQQESMLLVANFKQHLTEAQVIEFAKKCQKGLRLDWVENFTRPIPDDVVARKVEADKLKVFDNYVILHYDPKSKAFALTKEQEIAKKDPILFGVIEGVRKLYFIGDWKDDICQLTMEEVAKVLGHGALEINPDPTVEP